MVEIYQTFKNKKILITGHTGFKGTWLTLWLYLLGAKIIGFSKKTEKRKTDFFKLGLDKLILKSYYGELINYKRINQICRKHKPEIIFHLAAQAIVSEGIRDPYYTFNNNLNSTLSILEVFRLNKYIKTGIFITSDKVYKNFNSNHAYTENDELFGEDPYSASKSIIEIMINSYIKTFKNDFNRRSICTIRAGNVIGGGDYSLDRIVPDIFKSLKNKKKLIIRSPNSTRPWQYVLDCLNGYLRLTHYAINKPGKYNGAWNFGPKDTKNYKVKDLVNKISKNFQSPKIQITKNSIKEKKYLKLNSNKSKILLKWKPKLSIDKLISYTVDDYKNLELSKSKFFNKRKSRILHFMLLK